MQFNMKQPSFKFSDDVVGINKDETEWAKNWKKPVDFKAFQIIPKTSLTCIRHKFLAQFFNF